LKGKILVTAQPNPDIDRVACIIGYSELLQKQGIDAHPGIVGNIHREALFILENFNVNYSKVSEKSISGFDEFILVDSSSRTGLSENIDINKVVEIIDHRKSNEAHVFKNAKIQIEFVGAAATLIVEKFMESGTELSEGSRILLYGAIVSNTLNFKSNTTTGRDKKAAEWLKKRLNLPKDFVRRMFLAKSDFEGKNVRDILMQDCKSVDKDAKVRFSIFQLEVVDLERIIKDNKKEILGFLKEDKIKQNLDYIFLTGVDLEKGFNMFLAVDDKTKSLLEKALGIKFSGNAVRREGLLLRKEIIPIIERYF